MDSRGCSPAHRSCPIAHAARNARPPAAQQGAPGGQDPGWGWGVLDAENAPFACFFLSIYIQLFWKIQVKNVMQPLEH